jgi:hypothetical protein
MPDHDLQLPPRYEVRIHWERGKKRFAVHDLQQPDRILEMFDSVKEASIHCALLWLEHVRATRCDSAGTPRLTHSSSQRPSKVP